MRKSLVMIAALGMALMSVSCSGTKAPEGGAAPAPQKLRFAVIPKALDIPVFTYAKIGAERQAKEFGDVEILWNAPTSADQLKQ
jgi:ABC-type sugar transport system substrate-binding protein